MDALQGKLRRQSAVVQNPARLLNNLSYTHEFYLVWIPSHCGIATNKRVDELAKEGLKIPLETQVKIPRDMLDTRSTLKVQQKSNRLLPEDYEEQVGFKEARRAETLLARFYTGHTPELHPVSRYIHGRVLRRECVLRVKKDCEHAIIRCQRKSSSRKDLLRGQDRRLTIPALIRANPEKVLAFLRRERYLKWIDLDCVRHQNAFSTTKKKKYKGTLDIIMGRMRKKTACTI